MQDRAPAHTSKADQTWCQKNLPNFYTHGRLAGKLAWSEHHWRDNVQRSSPWNTALAEKATTVRAKKCQLSTHFRSSRVILPRRLENIIKNKRGSSTTFALISMLHHWLRATDGKSYGLRSVMTWNGTITWILSPLKPHVDCIFWVS